jgi:hypothetical protein
MKNIISILVGTLLITSNVIAHTTQTLDLKALKDAKSNDTGDPVKTVFVNYTADPVKVYWINQRGERILYTTLPKKGEMPMNTWSTHPWLITDEKGKPYWLFVVHESGEVKIK